jgi:hypothetical protein
LYDRGAFGEAIAVVELQHRHHALRIDLPEIAAGRRLLGLVVDLLDIDRQSGLARDDVRRQRTGAGRVVELHGDLLD